MATMTADAPVALAGLSDREVARQRRWVMGIVNVSHAFNHMNSGMTPILFAAMMDPLGFGYAQLGMLQAGHHIASNIFQAISGFVTQFAKRSVILGCGNILLGTTTILTGAAQGFSHLLVLRTVSGIGSSPQHPVGSTMLSTWFENARGRALGLHNTAGQFGTLLAIPLVTVMIAFLDWRVVMVIIGIPSLILGASYFILRDVVVVAPSASRAQRAKAGWSTYLACFKNRDLMLVSLLMMVGAAGRGGDLNTTYLVPHFNRDLGIAFALATSLLMVLQVGALIAPMAWGYISDKFPRKLVMQTSLVLSAVTTFWLGQQGALDVLLITNLAVHGLVIHSRQAITQAMVGDYAGPELHDAAFSIYFTIGLISGPIWTFIMGAIMQEAGFTIATQVMALSYIAGMLILIPLRIQPRPARGKVESSQGA